MTTNHHEPPGDNKHIDERIEKLTQAIKALGGHVASGPSADCPPEIHEQFLRHVLDCEEAPEVEPFEVLVRSGMALPPPDQLDDAQLTATLWDVIGALAALATFLEWTDHLSDRQLYARLWDCRLREPIALTLGPGAWYLDMSHDDAEPSASYLRYYADEETRRDWAREFRDYPMPEAEKPPFDRDRHLPRPPYWGDDRAS
jgi:hypothetical protein